MVKDEQTTLRRALSCVLYSKGVTSQGGKNFNLYNPREVNLENFIIFKKLVRCVGLTELSILEIKLSIN